MVQNWRILPEPIRKSHKNLRPGENDETRDEPGNKGEPSSGGEKEEQGKEKADEDEKSDS